MVHAVTPEQVSVGMKRVLLPVSASPSDVGHSGARLLEVLPGGAVRRFGRLTARGRTRVVRERVWVVGIVYRRS